MTKHHLRCIATILGVVGTLFMISTGFSLLPMNIAIFSGIACYVVAGAIETRRS